MDTYDIFKKLTTNLNFKKENSNSKSNGSLLLKNVNNEIENRDGDQEATTTTTKKLKSEPKKAEDLKKLLQLRQEELNHLKNVNHINASGNDIPDPIESFDQLTKTNVVNKKILENLLKYQFEKPSPVQMQVIPILLNNRNVMASAPTGSGKTLAFLFPILSILNEPNPNGSRALILAPTRELARQIYLESVRLTEGTKILTHLISKTSLEKKNIKSFKKYDLLITTPNKLISLLKLKELDLSTIEWLIIDEADKLFEDGENSFREQLSKIYKACNNPSLKLGMFSATYTNEVEQWCKLTLDNLVQVSIGRKNLASYSVEQEIVYVGNEQGKLMALRALLKQGFEPPILIFVQSKERANDLFKELLGDQLNVDIITSDRTQAERDNTIRAFRQFKIWILICTELMSRGIDFKGVNLVVNYDFPQSGISYVHRIGRSGRAGRCGKAVTYFTDLDLPFLKSIANIIRESGGTVPDYMLKLKNPNKKLKKELKSQAPKRKRIPVSKVIGENGQEEDKEIRMKKRKKKFFGKQRKTKKVVDKKE